MNPRTGLAAEAHVHDRYYRMLVDGVVDVAIYLLDAAGQIMTWSAAARRIHGYAPQEIIGQPGAILYPATALAEDVPAADLALARANGKYEAEGWRLRRDGTRFWARVTIDSVFDEDGAHIGFATLTRDVTEESLEEEQRRILTAAAPNGLIVTDDRGIVSLANARAERTFGYPPAALVGSSIYGLLSGAGLDIDSFLLTWHHLDRGAALSQFCAERELTGHRADGSTFDAEAVFSVTHGSRGPVIVVSVNDITVRRQSEQALVDANRLMSLAEEMAHCGHWRIDLSTRTMTFSDEMLRIHGFAPPMVPTATDGLRTFDPDGVDVAEIIRSAVDTGEPFTFESRIFRADGTVRDVRVSGQSEFDRDGRRAGLVGIILDITEHRRFEAALRAANRLMTMGEEMAHYGHWHVDLATRKETWSDELHRITGYPAPNIPAQEIRLQAFEERAAEIAAVLRQAAVDGQPFSFEARRKHPDGSYQDVRVAGRGERDANGTLTGVFGIVHDVTNVKDAERDRRWSTTFQRAVLPLRLPRVAGCSFDAIYEPGLAAAQVGGDWYDAVHLIDGRVLVSIGDVAGSGLEAAVVVGVARQVMRGVAQLNADPVRILDAADRELRLEYPGIYVSAWVGIVDLVERTVTYASAGHPPPLRVSRDGSVAELTDPTTLLIGLREGHRGIASTATLAQGDTLVLYTDGITEAGRDVLDGYRLVREAAALLVSSPTSRPADAIGRHVIPNGTSDDAAIMVVRTDANEAERFMQRLHFDARDARAAALARREIVTWLERSGFREAELANAEVILGELIGNVARHAQDSSAVEIVVDRSGPNTILHVLDRGRGFDHNSRLPSDPYAESGRGLYVVAALALDFTVSARTGGGSHARAVLSGGQPPRARPLRAGSLD